MNEKKHVHKRFQFHLGSRHLWIAEGKTVASP